MKKRKGRRPKVREKRTGDIERKEEKGLCNKRKDRKQHNLKIGEKL